MALTAAAPFPQISRRGRGFAGSRTRGACTAPAAPSPPSPRRARAHPLARSAANLPQIQSLERREGAPGEGVAEGLASLRPQPIVTAGSAEVTGVVC